MYGEITFQSFGEIFEKVSHVYSCRITMADHRVVRGCPLHHVPSAHGHEHLAIRRLCVAVLREAWPMSLCTNSWSPNASLCLFPSLQIKNNFGKPGVGASGPEGVLQRPGGTFYDLGSGTGKPVRTTDTS